jgi:hypothetical protein
MATLRHANLKRAHRTTLEQREAIWARHLEAVAQRGGKPTADRGITAAAWHRRLAVARHVAKRRSG